MATSKKRLEEQNLKTLRELTALENNKKCLECHQRGITYADMTTAGFVCVQCSGYLRGLNPPHRVKSISMTTFSESEIELLKKGGNEISRQVWLGMWNPRRDKEPDKKDEVAFKDFLVSKYERRVWYVNPSEVRKKEDKVESPKPEPKLQPPPAASKSPQTERPRGTPQPSVTPQPQLSQQPASIAASSAGVSVSTAPKVDLLGDLGGDPFAPKQPPVGGVSVLPPGGIPLQLKSSKQTTEEFGSFTSASQSSSIDLQSSATSTGTLSASDKYAALASLDQTLKEFRLQDPPPSQTPPTSQPSVGGGNGNPFGSPPGGGQPTPQQQQQQAPSNPFMTGVNSGPVTGPPGGAFGAQSRGAQFGGGATFPGQMGGGFGPTQTPQQFGAFGQQPSGAPFMQQHQQPTGQWGQPQGFAGAQGAFGGQTAVPPQQQQQQMQQWRVQQPQQQQWGAAQQPQAQQPQQWGMQQPQSQQQQWGAQQQARQQWGAMMPAQQQWRAQMAATGSGQFGGQPQQGVMGQQGQFPQQHFGQQQQFGGFVSGVQPQMQVQPQQQQKPPINWGGSVLTSQTAQSSPQAGGNLPVSSSSFGSSSTQQPQSSLGGGWSNQMIKQSPASLWGQPGISAAPPSSANSLGWSTGGGFGAGTSAAGGWSQNSGFGQPASQPQSWGGGGQQSGGQVNPFGGTSQRQTTSTNPFL